MEVETDILTSVLILQGGKIGCGILVPLSPVMTEMAIRNATEDAIYDRSFRIRNNKTQV